MDYLQCLEEVVGISLNPCPCYDEGREEAHAVSSSGYYMDNPDYGLPLNYPKTAHDCEFSDLWQLAEKARRDGIVQFVTEYGAALMSSRWIRKVSPFQGYIGSKTGANVLTLTDDVIGMRLTPVKHRGTRLVFHHVDIHGSGAASLTLEVFTETQLLTEASPTPLGILFNDNHNPSATVARYLPTSGEPISVELSTDGNAPEVVYLVAQRDGWTMKNNQFKCGSCGASRLEAWMKLVKAEGVAGPTEALLVESGASNYTNGLRPNVAVTCGNSWLCQNFDYTNDDWGRVMAELILLYSNRQLISYILASDNANVYTAARSEELIDKRTYINEVIALRLPWLAKHTPEDIQDCYRCLSRSTRKTLLV